MATIATLVTKLVGDAGPLISEVTKATSEVKRFQQLGDRGRAAGSDAFGRGMGSLVAKFATATVAVRALAAGVNYLGEAFTDVDKAADVSVGGLIDAIFEAIPLVNRLWAGLKKLSNVGDFLVAAMVGGKTPFETAFYGAEGQAAALKNRYEQFKKLYNEGLAAEKALQEGAQKTAEAQLEVAEAARDRGMSVLRQAQIENARLRFGDEYARAFDLAVVQGIPQDLVEQIMAKEALVKGLEATKKAAEDAAEAIQKTADAVKELTQTPTDQLLEFKGQLETAVAGGAITAMQAIAALRARAQELAGASAGAGRVTTTDFAQVTAFTAGVRLGPVKVEDPKLAETNRLLSSIDSKIGFAAVAQ